MTENLFIDSASRLLFGQHQLDQFEALWSLQLPWFEEPNQRRQGWSGVSRLELDGQGFFLKRQQNHNTRTLLHPLRGEPTFKREFENICRFAALQIPALQAVYYGERRTDEGHQAILITRALDDYQPMDHWYRDQLGCEQAGSLTEPVSATAAGRAVFDRVAQLFVDLHATGLAHWCPYPNHLFVRPDGSEARFIDLEKARRQPFALERRRKDLDCFLRHAGYMTRTDLEYLLCQYFERAGNLACAPRLGRDLKKRIDRLKR